MRQTKHSGLFPRRTIDSTLVASLLAVASAHATLMTGTSGMNVSVPSAWMIEVTPSR